MKSTLATNGTVEIGRDPLGTVVKRALFLALMLALGAAACDGEREVGVGTGGASGTGGTGGAGGAAVTPACPEGPTSLLGVAQHADEGAAHTVVCTQVTYGTTPPSSGAHYPNWPVYKTYVAPVPWGFLVHGLEHGAVAIVYNCPGGCADEVAAAQAWIDALPIDARCAARPRVILAPDPTLTVRWAATAWTWTLRACAFDIATFQRFFDDHYDVGPESVCGGLVDFSATGWCP
ncbi:MAG: DUF3105 domain-containing protein [Bacteroidota bacterium]